jgi:2-polyprenyl-6-methoxyphenol hydroxylase-like FAD-dependent oxidoreductase
MTDATAQNAFDADVLIVGGGPIGLTTACALAHHGVDCLLIEQRHDVKEWSRANNLWARPQELLASIGVRDAIAENAYAITRVNTLLNGRPVDPVAIADVPSPYGPVLYSGQDVIERTLAEQAEAKGGRIQRGLKLVSFVQDDDGVTLTVAPVSEDDEDTVTGPEQTLRCRYMIGADGSKGFIRGELGLGFEPEKLPNCMNRQIDAKLSWRRTTECDHLWFFYYPRGFCGVLPVWGGYHRLFFLADDTGIPDRDPTLEEMQAIAREVTEDETLTLTDPIWLTHSRFQHGAASHYAKDRVLLVGDAGHLSLPAGGQGMNSGFHDAIGVAWRLAMLLASEGGPALLASYDEERGGEHRRLDAQQVRGFQNSVYRGKIKDAVMDVAARFIPDLGTMIQGSADLQQLTVAYPDSPLSEDHLKGIGDLVSRHTPKAGERAPDAPVIAPDGAATTLFAHLYNPDGRTWGWALLGFDGRDAEALPDLRATFAAAAKWDWIRPRLVLGSAVAKKDDALTLSDLDNEAHAAYGISDAAVVLVRPDGHIAYRGRADKPDLLSAYCSRIFSKNAS